MSVYYNPELYHYGVKGMKWGRRKASYDTEPGGLYSRNRIPKDAKTDGYQKSKLPGPVMGGPTMNKQGNAVKNAAKSAVSMAKSRRVNRVESKLKAEKKADDARRDAYKALNKSPKKHSKFEYDVTAEKAAYAARKKSVLADKEHNRQVRAKRKADRALAKMEKQKYKDTIKQYRAEINKGASVAGKIYNKLTDADLYEAQIRYDMERRGYE